MRKFNPNRFRRRLQNDQAGATAIEFAAVIFPFMILIVCSLEIGIINMLFSSFKNGVGDALRGVRTGSAGCISVAQIKTDICENMPIAATGGCEANTKVSVSTITSLSPPDSTSTYDTLVEDVDVGGAESIILVEVFHRWEVITPLMDTVLGGSGGNFDLKESQIFRNEPFSTLSGCI